MQYLLIVVFFNFDVFLKNYKNCMLLVDALDK